jgi:hypothetical protein
VYVLEGFSAVLVFPSPKFQDHNFGEFAEVSVNPTVRGAVPEVGLPKKLATGGSGAVVAVVTGTVVAVAVTVVLAAAAGRIIPPIQNNPTQINKRPREGKNPRRYMPASLLWRGPCSIITPHPGTIYGGNSQRIAELLFCYSQILCRIREIPSVTLCCIHDTHRVRELLLGNTEFRSCGSEIELGAGAIAHGAVTILPGI